MARALTISLVFAAVLAGALPDARAAVFCVSCDGPAAHYACTFNDTTAIAGDSSLKLLCIRELAKAGNHASCAVDRTSATPCAGEVKTLALPEGLREGTALPAGAAASRETPAGVGQQGMSADPALAAPKDLGPRATDVPKSSQPPKTVKEMVEKGAASTGAAIEQTGDGAAKAAQTTGSAIENAGKAVGNAAKKTWHCITSLFGDC